MNTRNQKLWVKPTIEDLGSVTEITRRGPHYGSDRKQIGSRFS